jgi:hypothetical protein
VSADSLETAFAVLDRARAALRTAMAGADVVRRTPGEVAHDEERVRVALGAVQAAAEWVSEESGRLMRAPGVASNA